VGVFKLEIGFEWGSRGIRFRTHIIVDMYEWFILWPNKHGVRICRSQFVVGGCKLMAIDKIYNMILTEW